MKVRILQKFHDKDDYSKVFLVGETITLDDTRAEFLISRGLVEMVEEKKESKTSEPSELDKIEVEATKDLLFPKETPVKPVTATRRKSVAKAN